MATPYHTVVEIRSIYQIRYYYYYYVYRLRGSISIGDGHSTYRLLRKTILKVMRNEETEKERKIEVNRRHCRYAYSEIQKKNFFFHKSIADQSTNINK